MNNINITNRGLVFVILAVFVGALALTAVGTSAQNADAPSTDVSIAPAPTTPVPPEPEPSTDITPAPVPVSTGGGGGGRSESGPEGSCSFDVKIITETSVVAIGESITFTSEVYNVAGCDDEKWRHSFDIDNDGTYEYQRSCGLPGHCTQRAWSHTFDNGYSEGGLVTARANVWNADEQAGAEGTMEVMVSDTGSRCLIEHDEDDILVLFDEFYEESDKLVAHKASESYWGPLDAIVEAGTYKISAMSYDSHGFHGGQDQQKEEWKLELEDGSGTILATTPHTTDIPENDDYVIETLTSSLEVPEGVVGATARHAHVGVPNIGPQSVIPICAVLERTDDPPPPVEPVCTLKPTGDQILIDFTEFPDLAGDPEGIVVAHKGTEDARLKDDFFVPAGVYDITLSSFDDHTGHGGQQQFFEQYHVRFRDAADSFEISRTEAISDIPENEDGVTELVEDDFELTQDAYNVVAFHDAYPAEGPESVYPLCALLDPQVITPEETDLTIYKDVEPSVGIVGTSFTYTLTYENLSSVDAENVTITDTPTPTDILENYKITKQPNHGSCSVQGNDTIVCDLGTVGAGESGTIEYTADSIAEGTVDNTAVIETTTPETDYTNNEDEAQIIVTEQPLADVAIRKNVDPYEGVVGTSFTYTLGYKNLGNTSAHNVEINDSATPAGILTNYQITKQPEHGICIVLVGNTIVCDLGTLLAGESGTIEYTADSIAEGTVDNTAVIETTTDESNYRNNEDEAKVIVTEQPLADVAITKSVTPNQRRVGGVFNYTLEYTNLGGADAVETVITDRPIQEGIIDNFKITKQPEHGSCSVITTAISSEIRCNLGTLPVGEGGTIEYTADAIAVGHVDNIAYITTHTDEVTLENNTDKAWVRVVEELFADVTVTKTVTPSMGEPGQVFAYTLRYDNLGNKDAVNTTLIDDATPNGVLTDYIITKQPEHGSCEVVGVVAGDLNTDDVRIICDFGTLPVGEGGTIEYTAIGSKEGTVTNTVNIETTTEETNYNNNTDEEIVIIEEGGGGGDDKADVSIIKIVDPGSGEPGQVFTYTLTYNNEGDLKAEDVTIEDTATPENILNNYQIIKQPEHGSCTANSNGISCNLGDLAVGDNGTIKYTADSIAEGTVDNTAVIETITPEDDYNNNDDNAQVVIETQGCTENCGGGGGGGGRRNPDVVLFSTPDLNPLVLDSFIYLSQVPYTGVGTVTQIILFILGLIIITGLATYFVLRNKTSRPTPEAHVEQEREATVIEERVVRGEAQEAYVPFTAPEHFPTTEPAVETAHVQESGTASLEERARRDHVLLSPDAARMLADSVKNDAVQSERKLYEVVEIAKTRWPREDGWLLINRTRMSEMLFTDNVSTVSTFVQWLTEGNESKAFTFIRTLGQQGKSAEDFIHQVVGELDSVYRTKLEGLDYGTDPSVMHVVRDLSMNELESVITHLTHGVDGGYSSPLVGIKVSLTRVIGISKKTPSVAQKTATPQHSKTFQG